MNNSESHVTKIICCFGATLFVAACVPEWAIRDAYYENSMNEYNGLYNNKAMAFGRWRDQRGGRLELTMDGNRASLDEAIAEALAKCQRASANAETVVLPCHIVMKNDETIEDISEYTHSARQERQAKIDGAIDFVTALAVGAAAGATASSPHPYIAPTSHPYAGPGTSSAVSPESTSFHQPPASTPAPGVTVAGTSPARGSDSFPTLAPGCVTIGDRTSLGNMFVLNGCGVTVIGRFCYPGDEYSGCEYPGGFGPISPGGREMVTGPQKDNSPYRYDACNFDAWSAGACHFRAEF